MPQGNANCVQSDAPHVLGLVHAHLAPTDILKMEQVARCVMLDVQIAQQKATVRVVLTDTIYNKIFANCVPLDVRVAPILRLVQAVRMDIFSTVLLENVSIARQAAQIVRLHNRLAIAVPMDTI